MDNIIILEGDITTAEVDAIVNAANPQMLGGGGVDGAIHRAAGPQLLIECKAVAAVNGQRCPVGQARITAAGKLKSDYVIHTVGPRYTIDASPELLLESAYHESLQLAISHHCQSIAFPAISCGVYGYPAEAAAQISLSVCSGTACQELTIYFYLYGQEFLTIWNDAYQRLKSSISV